MYSRLLCQVTTSAPVNGAEPPPACPRSSFRAFVIGNNAYQHLPPLSKCINDANAMAKLLGRKGYDVTVLLDTTSEAFRDQVCCFAESLCPGDTVVVHFSGHGLQQRDGNRLVFIDESIEGDPGKMRAVALMSTRLILSIMRFPAFAQVATISLPPSSGLSSHVYLATGPLLSSWMPAETGEASTRAGATMGL
jgi:hypothetical protein